MVAKPDLLVTCVISSLVKNAGSAGAIKLTWDTVEMTAEKTEKMPPLCEHEYYRDGMWRCKVKTGNLKVADDYCDRTESTKVDCPNYKEE